MPVLAGQTLTAAQLTRLKDATYGADGTNLTLDVVEADLPLATVTVSTTTANAIYIVRGTFDFLIPTFSIVTTATGRLNVDGSTLSKGCDFIGTANGARATGSQEWRGTLVAAGNHTFKLRGIKSGAGGVMQIFTSTLSVTIQEVV